MRIAREANTKVAKDSKIAKKTEKGAFLRVLRPPFAIFAFAFPTAFALASASGPALRLTRRGSRRVHRRFFPPAHPHIALITGRRLCPRSVSEYSTFGGTWA